MKRVSFVLVGAVCAFIVALLWGLLCTKLKLGDAFDLAQLAQLKDQLKEPVRFVLANLVLSPFLETIPFLLGLWLTLKIAPEKARFPVFLALMLTYGWALHGANVLAIGRGAAFAILGVVAFTSKKHRGYLGTFVDTACAHAIWNVLGTLVILFFL